MKNHALFVLYPIDEAKHLEVLAALQAAAPSGENQQPEVGHIPLIDALTLTKIQQEIAAALTSRTLNNRQIGVLEAHLRNFRAGGGQMTIHSVATYLVERGDVHDHAQAVKYVEGALRSFGKRLKATLTKIPFRIGKDPIGDGVADAVPLLAMFSIVKDDHGQTRHRFTQDAEAAVALVLGAKASGMAASSPLQEGENVNEVVGLLMSANAAALIERVTKTLGVTRDEAILHMTALAGAG